MTPSPAYIPDISAGHEPLVIPLHIDASTSPPLFTYITDSILPSGAQLSTFPPPSSPSDRSDSDTESDHDNDDGTESEDGEGQWACACPADGSACSVIDGDSCDCVGTFGNFYARTGENKQILLLGSLPPKLPLVECSPHCGCGEGCENRLTQGGIRVPLAVKTSQAGYGAYHTGSNVLPTGSFISLYAGEYLTTEEARARWRENHGDNYILSLRLPDQTVHIDPRHHGNFGRFLNHSCDPNCVIHVVRRGGGLTWPRAAIFAKRPVGTGEELTFDYGDASGAGGGPRDEEAHGGDDARTRCLCGTAKCRGWMPFDETL